jgi:DNA repair photolyase
MLRLPHEVKNLFRDWLAVHLPQRAEHVMSLVQQMRGGKDYDPRFGLRQTGQGEFAAVIAQRFRIACQRAGLALGEGRQLETRLFRVPPLAGTQVGFDF